MWVVFVFAKSVSKIDWLGLDMRSEYTANVHSIFPDDK